MIRMIVAACLLSLSLIAHQDDTVRQDPITVHPPSGTTSDTTKAAPKAKPKTVTPLKTKTTSTAGTGTDTSGKKTDVPQLAASQALDALETTIQFVSAGASHPVGDAPAALKNLRAQLSAGGDPKLIAAQASKLTSELYQPPAGSHGAASSTEVIGLSTVSGPLWILVLISLLSPIICVAGFLLGIKMMESHLRNSLREAGLL